VAQVEEGETFDESSDSEEENKVEVPEINDEQKLKE
tara:strand:- start:889 stop:996 length:108 start_codon:yes stop_codon:yes gene_type:complete